jgi:hypothetical protein
MSLIDDAKGAFGDIFGTIVKEGLPAILDFPKVEGGTVSPLFQFPERSSPTPDAPPAVPTQSSGGLFGLSTPILLGLGGAAILVVVLVMRR